jgi:predicted glycoside hydrolase/deacetylase ChbG (UPF0249 family)
MRSILLMCCCALTLSAQKRMLVCGDDSGALHSINDATIEAFEKGIERCANVIVAGPWFNDIAARLNERPGIAVGVHLAITSEWDKVKWRPLTSGKTIVDADGYLPANNRALLNNKPDLKEVEAELRAQIERAKRSIKQVMWLWPHMGTATATPEFRAITEKLSKEYNLPILGVHPGIKRTNYPRPKAGETAAQAWQTHFESLGPGNYFFIEHPATDTAEARGMTIGANTGVAQQRVEVLRTWTDPAVKEALHKAGVALMTPDQARAALQ